MRDDREIDGRQHRLPRAVVDRLVAKQHLLVALCDDAEPQVVDAVQGLGWRLATMQREGWNRSGVIAVGLGKAPDGASQGARCRRLGRVWPSLLGHEGFPPCLCLNESLAPARTSDFSFPQRIVILGNELDGSGKRFEGLASYIENTMKHISIGGLDVSRIGLGAMSMSGYYNIGAVNDAESIRAIHRALDLGVTHLDTAEIYGPYTNEELVGRAIKDRRDQVVLATKFGIVSHAGGGPGVLDSSPANIRAAVEGSLKRLGTDHIDLYYQHRVDPNTPIEDTVGALADARRRGQGPLHRVVRGWPRHDPARPRGASRRCAADRVLAVDP